MFEKRTVWWIEAITGCTCCADQNFDQGFYFDEETPTALVERWRRGDGNPLASQFAKYGRYRIRSAEAEILPDGRMIVEGTVFGPNENVDCGEIIYW